MLRAKTAPSSQDMRRCLKVLNKFQAAELMQSGLLPYTWLCFLIPFLEPQTQKAPAECL